MLAGFQPLSIAINNGGSSGLYSERQIRAAVGMALLGQAIDNVLPMQEVVNTTIEAERLSATVATWLCLAALALAAVGLYAVLSVAVSTRQHELAIRCALGANGRRLFLLIATQGLRQLAYGMAIGGAAWAILSRSGMMDDALGGLTVDISALLPFAVLFGIGLLAVAIPALRAARVEPSLAVNFQ